MCLSVHISKRSITPWMFLHVHCSLSLGSSVGRSYKKCRLNFTVWLSSWTEHPSINCNNRFWFVWSVPPSKSMNQNLKSEETIFVSSLKKIMQGFSTSVFADISLATSETTYFYSNQAQRTYKLMTLNKINIRLHPLRTIKPYLNTYLHFLVGCYRKLLHIQNIFGLSLAQN